MRVFKWSPTFTPTQESSIVPVWVSLPELPAHLIRKDVMFVIANIIGTPLQIDSSKLSKARVCVEIDLLKPMLQEVDLQICGETIVQKVEYEQVPLYARYANMWGTKAPNVIRKDKNYVQADVNVTGIDIGILETENNLHDDAPHEIVVHTGGAENFMQVTDSDIVINYADEDSCVFMEERKWLLGRNGLVTGLKAEVRWAGEAAGPARVRFTHSSLPPPTTTKTTPHTAAPRRRRRARHQFRRGAAAATAAGRSPENAPARRRQRTPPPCSPLDERPHAAARVPIGGLTRRECQVKVSENLVFRPKIATTSL
ncbi:UNVERIFIED_CONTAM: hypothetical protein Sradi_3241200 [Sesamum radiatum]|uniref:DUF4283 domain-containing protein n=1 Tax=Sesamum radiatum TaxID=300843 RepID=A0AAW2RH06_SESRA